MITIKMSTYLHTKLEHILFVLVLVVNEAKLWMEEVLLLLLK